MSNYKSYFYKSMGLREDQLPELQGGKGQGMEPNQVDQEQLQMGIKVEMEHTNDQELAKEIAMDHLAEDPQYYSHLKAAGMADELPNGQQPPNQPPMQMQKLMSPSAMGPNIIGVAVRGTKTGLLPAGGVVADPDKCARGGLEKMNITPPGTKDTSDKARLGGLEPVKNPKTNSQGAFANTPTSDVLKVDAGHYTPDNKDITQGKSPETSKKGDTAIHPMQIQQLGNPPPTDDGTGHDGSGLKPTGEEKPVEPHPMSGPIANPEGGTGAEKDLTGAGIDDENPEKEEEPTKGPWGIELDGEEEDEEEKKKDGEDVTVDIKESVKECATCGCGEPSMKDRFQKLANVTPETEEDKIKQLQELVGRLNAKGQVTPLLQKAQAYLVKRGK